MITRRCLFIVVVSGAVVAITVFAATLEWNIGGGGGSLHHAPKHIVGGQQTQLQLKLTPGAEGRYSDVTCNYRVSRDSVFVTIPMQRVGTEGKWALWECALPPFDFRDVQSVEYYFEMFFDGHYNRRNEKALYVVHSATSATAEKE